MKTVRFTLLTTLVLGFFSMSSFAQLKVIADGKVGIGTSTPARQLEVLGGGCMFTNNGTYPNNKQSNFLMRHYSDPNVHFAYFNAQSDLNNNQVLFGGGSGGQYAATTVAFLTTANTTTVLGTERLRVNNLGQIRMNTAGAMGALTHELNLITGDASKPGGGSWATPSDARIKTNVHPFTDGLQQVLQIKPVFFQYKPETGYPSDKEYVGIIAQEMQKIAPYTVEEVKVKIEGDDTSTKLPETLLTYQGTAVTYMLINAIKEQQEMINERDRKIEDLEARLDKIEAMLTNNGTTPGSVTNITLEGANGSYLKQNAPNPFSVNTSIEYSLPKNFTTAYIQISNVQGAVMRKVDLPKAEGVGALNIKARELAPGDYVYTLVVDGKIIDTKKMVLINN